MTQDMLDKLAEYSSDDNEVLLNDMQTRSINTEEISNGINVCGQIRLVLGYLMTDNNVEFSILSGTIRDYVELIVGNVNDHYSIIGQAIIELESIEYVRLVKVFDPFDVIIDDYVWSLLVGENLYS